MKRKRLLPAMFNKDRLNGVLVFDFRQDIGSEKRVSYLKRKLIGRRVSPGFYKGSGNYFLDGIWTLDE